MSQRDWSWRPFEWNGLKFQNRFGAAGGLDKNAQLIETMPRLASGFHEVGTVTPRPQAQNPGRVLMKDPCRQNLWNALGFPNLGMIECYHSIANAERVQPLFVNIGKNRDTPLERAHQDYTTLTRKLNALADVFVVNVSSPNTQGLRQLQSPQLLHELIDAVLQYSTKPVLLKLSPDLHWTDFQEVLPAAVHWGVQGFVLTNTTLFRHPTSTFPLNGGLSGSDLRSLSRFALKESLNILGDLRKRLLIVSVGGIDSVEEMTWRLENGADLIQTYSAFAFRGPFLFVDWIKALQA